MSEQALNWLKEVIKTKVSISYQANGAYLDNTMMNGDTQAGLVKFPIAGRVEAYELTGAIQPVQASSPDLTTVQVQFKDFEASAWHRIQDMYKIGPAEQTVLSQLISKAIRRQRDMIKWNALKTFYALTGIDTIGDGSVAIDILDTEQGAAEIFATGAGEDDGDMIFCPMPEMWFSQMMFYKEFADAKYAGPEDLPFSKAMRRTAKTVRRITYFTMPDEYFEEPEADEQYSYMWARSSMGAETPWNGEAPSMTQHHEMEGSPWLLKAGVSGAAIGIQKPGVKRLRFKKITRPERPVIMTQTVV